MVLLVFIYLGLDKKFISCKIYYDLARSTQQRNTDEQQKLTDLPQKMLSPFFWGHWYPCFGFLVIARVGSALFAFCKANVMYIP